MSLGPLDLRFGQYYSPDNENGAFFLAALLAASRMGHLCIQIENKQVYPSFGEYDRAIVEGAFELEGVSHGNQGRWYLKRNWVCESSFHAHFHRLLSGKPTPTGLPALEGLSPEQQEAVAHALQHPLTIISGGPGTGKTYTAAKILALFSELKGGKIALSAPTGKATAHLKEVLGEIPLAETYTLHSLLKVPHFSQFSVILVDECSMVDAYLMESLFSKVLEGTHLILLGDVDQLPPVDSGHFFRSLCASSHCMRLSAGFRTDKKELIELAAKVRSSQEIPFSPLLSQRKLLDTLISHLPSQKVFSQEVQEAYEKVRFLSALRKGPYGVDALNQLIYKRQRARGVQCHPIMIKENAVQKGFVNGDVGIIEGEKVWLSGGRECAIWEIPPYELAYVISIHKSQGSEYDQVWMLLPPGSEEFGRELVYTGVTRAKKRVEIFSSKEVLRETLSKHTQRLSGIYSQIS
jgi:exodeoxyribonuclease V alpha subunit